MTPELCPLWCVPTVASFSSTASRSPGCPSSRAIAVARPTSPAPITTTSNVLPSAWFVTSGPSGWRRADLVAQHPEPGHLEFHGVAGDQPPAVVVLEDASGADRAGADDIPGPQHGVPGRLVQDVRPGV